MMPREYVGLVQWKILRALCDAGSAGVTIAEMSADIREQYGDSRPGAAVESLREWRMLEHACPPADHEPSRWCRVRITERGENARLDRRGRRKAALSG